MITPQKKLLSLVVALLVVSTAILSACSAPMATPAPRPEVSMDYQAKSMAPAATMAPAVEYAAEEAASAGGAVTNSSGAANSNRLVIKNANLTIVVADPPKSMEKISALAEEMGGFVVSANLYETQLETGVKVPQANITIRVDAKQLDEALKRIKAESDRLPINETISSQDVTAEYTDQQSNLKNLEATEKQLTAIMEDAHKTEEVLAVYNQLVEIRRQIEVTKGQIKYYEQSAALSAIEVQLVANETVQPLTIGSWQPVGIAKDAVQALINTLKVLVEILIWIVIYVLPVLALLFVIFFLPLRLGWRALRRKMPGKKQQPPAETPPSETK